MVFQSLLDWILNSNSISNSLNPLQANVPFLYSLETSVFLTFLEAIEKSTLAWNWLVLETKFGDNPLLFINISFRTIVFCFDLYLWTSTCKLGISYYGLWTAALEIRKNGRRQKVAIVYVLLDCSSAAKISTCFLLFQSLKVIKKC